MSEPRVINFSSAYDTPMQLVRDEDGEVLLRVLDDDRQEVRSEVYVDPDEMIELLRRI